MGSILAASFSSTRPRRCARTCMNETPDSDGTACRLLAGLFLCTFGFTAYYITKPETVWLGVARVGILTLTCTSALIILTPFDWIKTALRRIKRRYPPPKKLAPPPVTSCMDRSKSLVTIDIPSKIESKLDYPFESPLGSPLKSSLQSYENISVVS